MDREREETNSSHYVPNRLSLWCPVCGAAEGKGCIPVKHAGHRMDSHNAYALGTVPRPVIPVEWVTTPERKDSRLNISPARKDAPKKAWTPNGWIQ
jgi:hypothetical protein